MISKGCLVRYTPIAGIPAPIPGSERGAIFVVLSDPYMKEGAGSVRGIQVIDIFAEVCGKRFIPVELMELVSQ